MDATEVAGALAEWAKATCPDLQGSYDQEPVRKTAPLPDVSASVAAEAVRANAPELGLAVADGLEQADLHVVNIELMLMADPSDPEAATEQLRGFFRDLRTALKEDDTLGGRVPAASPYISVSYDPPYIEWDDGTKAQVAFVSLIVADLD